MAYTQDEKLISIATPLGDNVLLLSGFTGAETISRGFEFELSLLSERPSISFNSIMGSIVTVTINLADGNKRYLNGIISSFSQGAVGGEGDEDARFTCYRATLVPWFRTLAHSAGSKIFQNLSVPEIVERVFKARGYSDYRMELRGSYEKREFCVQYRETDFNFVSRLLEEEGISYFFEHEKDKHTMILADTADANKPCPYQKTASCQLSGNAAREEDVIFALEITRQIRASKYTLNDFNFKVPNTGLNVEVREDAQAKSGEREIYDAPGNFDKRSAGDRLAKIRMEEEEAQSISITGRSDCRAFASGYRFTLRHHSNPNLDDKDYLLLSVRHDATEGYDADAVSTYQNNFECLPHTLPFRPPRITPKPVVQGTQTAIVVGPSGEEIYTDRHGRVKVQFHWDREGKKDDNSSCWIRVSQLWAGNGWGGLHLPRVGQEVIVDFLEGDPDRPIIVGQLYNGVNLPPYPLPEGRTRSGIKSSSTPGGEGCNEIRFEDKKGEEQLFIHSEKRQDNRVKGDSLEWVGQDRHLVVGRNRYEKVSGDLHLTIAGDRNEKVDGTLSVTVNADLQQKVGMKHALEARQEIHLKAGSKLVLESIGQISLKVGGSFINIDPAGVTIVGNSVSINKGGSPACGCGISAEEPAQPREADKSGSGTSNESTAAEPVTLGPQAAALKAAAQSKAPLCDT
ncbi:MAG TPA: type VI secretion system tip protein VgrG [Geobacter sp.]|nr:type VI secretion system tip protein VgrG [Geobacter sp.]